MSLAYAELLFDYLKTLPVLAGIIGIIWAFCYCFKINCDNKLRGGGYIAMYLKHTKKDPTLRAQMMNVIMRTEAALPITTEVVSEMEVAKNETNSIKE